MSRAPNKFPDPLLDIRAVAAICGVSEKTVRRWINAQELPAAKLGSLWRIPTARNVKEIYREPQQRVT
jgi:excisionase family DNA binding protein